MLFLFEVFGKEIGCFLPGIDGFLGSVVVARRICKCMTKTRIDIDFVVFFETGEIFLKELYLFKWNTRILVTKYSKYGSLKS